MSKKKLPDYLSLLKSKEFKKLAVYAPFLIEILAVLLKNKFKLSPLIFIPMFLLTARSLIKAYNENSDTKTKVDESGIEKVLSEIEKAFGINKSEEASKNKTASGSNLKSKTTKPVVQVTKESIKSVMQKVALKKPSAGRMITKTSSKK